MTMWWNNKSAKPAIFEFDDDGQRHKKVFVRTNSVSDNMNTSGTSRISHEYAIVTYTDDGEAIDFLVLKDGKVQHKTLED